MKVRTLFALAAVAACFDFATPASGQTWGIGPRVAQMAQDGVLGRDLSNWVWRNRQQWLLHRQQGPPYGNAWGLRGGKPYTGNGNPLNGIPNGRPFQPRVENGNFSRDRFRRFREFPGRHRDTRDFGRGRGNGKFSRGGGFGNGRGRRGSGRR